MKKKPSGWDRGSSSERGYGTAWKKLRLHVIRRDQGFCVACRKRGELVKGREVDHIVRKADGGTDDISNLQLLCKEHHRKKTR